MGTVHEFGSQRNRKAKTEDELTRVLRAAVNARVGRDAPFAERELAALALTNEATRGFLEDELETVATRHGDLVEVDGRFYRRHEPGTVRYYSLCGPMDIERFTYREMGVQNGPTIVPMDLEAGLVERATPALGFRVALGYAKDHMRSCEEDMTADHRCPPSRSTLERLAKAIGTMSKEEGPRLERRVRAAERVPEGAVAVSLGVDRTTVPMEEPLAPGELSTIRRKQRRKPYQRAKPEPVEVNYRMAYVGTVAFHDANGEELATYCYTAAAHEEPREQLIGQMMNDLRNALRQEPKLNVGVIQDGAPELWNLTREALAAEPLVGTVHEAIDRYHLNARLANVLRAVEPDAATRSVQLGLWNDELDRSDDAIADIRAWVRRKCAAAIRRNDSEVLDLLEPDRTYLDNNHDRMRYASMRQLGLPVGSGITEGACKSAITKRANTGGQRWRPAGLEAVLYLRSLHLSERLPRFWANFARLHRKEVVCAA